MTPQDAATWSLRHAKNAALGYEIVVDYEMVMDMPTSYTIYGMFRG